ncbi:hypothetical protein [Hanstruepera flava]|uniref:hypothetical protein n=1 Tax=Hanstruepera flava TaxID=2930218 RepID=UPI0020280173|nr:hypothetical protein [Hanstruepera flava]
MKFENILHYLKPKLQVKTATLFLGLLYGFLILSCSSDDDNSDANQNIIKPSKYTIEGGGYADTRTVNFEYSGNLISKITTDFGTTIQYNYLDGELVSYETTESGEPNYLTYITYNAEGKMLQSRTDDDADFFHFYYNSSGQIDEALWIGAGGIFTSTTLYGYDSMGNVIALNRLGANASRKFKYDNKNNAFRNVFPQVDANVSWDWLGSQVNNQIEVQKEVGTGVFSTLYTYEYEYNENNYPLVRRKFKVDGTLFEIVTYEY